MPSGDSTSPIYLSSDSEEDGDIMRGMLSAAMKGKGRTNDIDMALDADQGVEKITAENQTAYTGSADVSVNGTRASTPGKPSSVAVMDVLPHEPQSSSNRDELHQYSSTGLRNQQGIEETSQPSAARNPTLDNSATPLGKHAPSQASPAPRSAGSTNIAAMPTIAEDGDTSSNVFTTPTTGLKGSARTDMAHFAQLLRRSLSIADCDVGAANQTNTSKIGVVAAEPIVRIPTPSPRPSFVLVSVPTPDKTNANTNTETHGTSATVSECRPRPSAASTSSISRQDRDNSREKPRQEQTVDLIDVLRLLEDKERRYKSLKEQLIEEESDIGTIKNMVRTLINQGQSMSSTAVANQSSPNTSTTIAHNHASIESKAMPNSHKHSVDRKANTDIPTPRVAANAGKGKTKEIVHATVAPVEPKRKVTSAERKAASNQRRAEKKLAKREKKLARREKKSAQREKELAKRAPKISFAFLEAGQHAWGEYPGKCIRPFNWKVLDSLPPSPPYTVEPTSSVQFPHPIFWTPSPSNPETLRPPYADWTLGTFENGRSPALTPRLLWVDNIPAARCNLRSLISWFQLFGALIYVEHAGSANDWAILEYADSLGAWRAMTCKFPAWGDITVSARYASLMEVKGYGKGREKGRTTLPPAGIQPGTSASDSMKGNRGVKRSKENTEIEDREVDVHLGIPVPPSKAPVAGPSRPGIMTRQWLTKIIDGQEYVIVDGDEDDPGITVHDAPPIKVATKSASKGKKGKRRRPQRALPRPETIKKEPVEVELPPPLDCVEMETSDREDEASIEYELQDDEVEDRYDVIYSSEEEDNTPSDSEASTIEILEPDLL